MDSVEVKGKSVDEAIFNGLNKLGVGLDEVTIDILEEGSKGLFGLGRSAVVRLTVKDEEELLEEQEILQTAPEVQEEPPVQRPSARRDHGRNEPREKRPAPPREKSPQLREEPEAPKAPEEEPPKAPVPEKPEPPVKSSAPPIVTPESEAACDFLNGLLRAMPVDAQCTLAPGSDEKNMKLMLTGKDTAVLIGRRGDTLDALQYLAGLVVNKNHEEYIRVMLNAEDYREKREQTLERLANRLANNVIRTGKPVKLEPMNPYERRILHSTLQSNPKVETFSEGTDPYRRVVIRRINNAPAAHSGHGKGRGGHGSRGRRDTQ